MRVRNLCIGGFTYLLFSLLQGLESVEVLALAPKGGIRECTQCLAAGDDSVVNQAADGNHRQTAGR